MQAYQAYHTGCDPAEYQATILLQFLKIMHNYANV